MKKLIISALLSLFMILTFIYPAAEGDSSPMQKECISKMTPSEQVQFLQENGIDLPPYAYISSFNDFIIALVSNVEKDPDYPVAISNPVIYELGIQIKDAINKYYRRCTDQSLSN